MPSYLLTLLLLLPLAYGWTSRSNVVHSPSFVALRSSTFSVKMPGENGDVPSVNEMDSGNPCWEDFYDDDCAMSNVAAAAFVAGEWIKKLPCAKGLEDCMPEDLLIPENRPEYGMDHVDVMGYLGLKRASPLSKKEKEDDDDAVAP